jgi:asparagine synthase (glutamine-hydrolysing)
MPGIYGLVDDPKAVAKNLSQMREAMHLYDHFVLDQAFVHDSLGASRVHLGNIGASNSPQKDQQNYVWVEGEAYNLSQVCTQMGFDPNLSLSELLLMAESSGQLESCLHGLDGYFCAALYNPVAGKVKLVSDRYGMRLLYWYHKEGIFAWGSEVKAILAIEGLDKEFDPTSFHCFMEFGHLLGNNTWFEHIKLIKPATILEYCMISNKGSQRHYWKWSDIAPSQLTFEQARDKMGELFIEAVAKRFDPKERIGLALSGGLDSRAILAAILHLYPDYKGYVHTFGLADSDDMRIARRVVGLTNWQHDRFELNQTNWFVPRIQQIWNTDGMYDLLHMHGCEFAKSLSNKIDINLNGYLGGAIAGGCHWDESKIGNKGINKEIAYLYYGRFAQDYEDSFYAGVHFDNYLFMNRGRRFSNYGTSNFLPWIQQRKPFSDNAFVELIFSIPEQYRAHNRLYAAMLQKFFPTFFKSIPWDKTGQPAGPLKNKYLLLDYARRAINKSKRMLKISIRKPYSDYPNWIQEPEVATRLKSLLANPQALYHRFTPEDLSQSDYEVQLKAATVEFYLNFLENPPQKQLP